MKRLAVLPALGLCLALGCASDPNAPGSTPVVAAPDVYVAGVELVGNYYKAVSWKNGVITHLDSGQYGARATGIAYANGHTYVTGFIGSVTGGYNRATLWVDGTATSLAPADRNSTATGITVSGQDVYISGCESALPGVGTYYATAEYWKNGVQVPLVTGTNYACANAITTSGTDLYVLGSVDGYTLIGPNSYAVEPIVTVWKNAVPQSLTDGKYYSTSGGFSVSGGHVYVAGSFCSANIPDCSSAAYWVDGVPTALEPTALAQASGIAVSGGTIYTAVNAATTSGGNLAQFAAGSTVSALASDSYSGTYAVTAYNGDIYIVGYDYYGPSIWKNRNSSYLVGAQGGPGNSYAAAIAIVPAS